MDQTKKSFDVKSAVLDLFGGVGLGKFIIVKFTKIQYRPKKLKNKILQL